MITPHEKKEILEELQDYMEKSINSKMQAYEINLRNLLNEVKMMRSEIQPVISAFTDSKQYRMVWNKTGVQIRKTATWVVIVGGAFTVIWAAIKYGVKLILLR